MNNTHVENIDIAIVTAMDIEMEFYHEQPITPITLNHINYAITEINGLSIVLLVTEMGLTNATAKTAALILEFNPKLLFFSGIAGGLSEKTKLTDVVLGKDVFSVETKVFANQLQKDECKYGILAPHTFSADKKLLTIAESIDSPFPIHTGALASSDHFPAPPTLLQEMSNMDAISIDMESSGFSHACSIFNKPSLCIRGISNHLIPGEDISLSHDDVHTSSKNAAHIVKRVISELRNDEL